jgi:hypothetical protein
MYGLHTRIRKEKRSRRIPTRALTESHQTDVGRIPRDQNEAVYATMQEPLLPPSASIGIEGEGSDSGTSEVMVKSAAKESIVVCMWCAS